MLWSTLKIKLLRLKRFEYWPYLLFYFPMFFYGFYLAIRSGRLIYWSPANPMMKHGGVVGVSKYEILSKVDSWYIAKTVFIKWGETLDVINKKLLSNGLSFPLIAKPDIGERGKIVEKVNNENELKEYVMHTKEDILLQEYVDFDLELGVLYFRYPDDEEGHITSVVQKAFLQITGDGVSTIEQLIDHEIRAYGRRAYLKDKFRTRLDEILTKDDVLVLEPIGNHNRGTTFLNGNHLINKKLESVFDDIAFNLKGFYYGRFDIRVPSLDDLYTGTNIRILELNGVSSEPAHIYDPGMTLLNAYRVIIKHMKIIYQIANTNAKRGYPYSTIQSFLTDLKQHFKRDIGRKMSVS